MFVRPKLHGFLFSCPVLVWRKSLVLVVTDTLGPDIVDGMATIEFTRFAISQDRTEALVAAHAAMVARLAAGYGGFRGACLVRVADDEWIDITVWDSDTDADSAIVRFPGTSGFFQLTDRILGQERGRTVVEDSRQD